MSIQPRQPQGIPAGGQFAASVRDEVDVNLAGENDGFTRTYGAFTATDKHWATVRTTNGGEVSGYITTQGATYPMDVTMADGHVVGLTGWRIKDVRLEDTPEPQEPGPAEVSAQHLADVDPDYDDEEFCVADDCDESLDGGEGFDGYCGTHADKIERHNQGSHRPVGGTDDEDEPTEGRDGDCPNCNGAGVNWG